MVMVTADVGPKSTENTLGGSGVLCFECEDRVLVLPSSDNNQASIDQVSWLDPPMRIDSLAVQIETTHCH